MASKLIITEIDNLQDEIVRCVKSLSNDKVAGIYVSLNKTQKSIEEILRLAGINVDRLFFVDCVTSEKTRDDVLHIRPEDLDILSIAVQSFIKDIRTEKFIIIDALSTLLIYNSENVVARFVKELTDYASINNVNIVALSPKTHGEELLDKIFNFFDKVEEK